ncbi:MAG: hypothetical protein ACRDM7_15935 [Thermoleophilaceae bacterium]
MSTADTTRCDMCGELAAYLNVEHAGEALCEGCARERSAYNRGVAAAALQSLDVAVQMLYSAGLSDEQVWEAAGQALRTHRHGPSVLAEYFDVSGWPGRFEEDRRYVALPAGSGA